MTTVNLFFEKIIVATLVLVSIFRPLAGVSGKGTSKRLWVRGLGPKTPVIHPIRHKIQLNLAYRLYPHKISIPLIRTLTLTRSWALLYPFRLKIHRLFEKLITTARIFWKVRKNSDKLKRDTTSYLIVIIRQKVNFDLTLFKSTLRPLIVVLW